MAAKNWLIYRIHDRALAALARKYFYGRLVDIGCGVKPYRKMMAGIVAQHVGVDHAESFHDRIAVDLSGSAYRIPAEAGSFDSALCTSVLEHLEEPEQAVRECRRLLMPGGVAIYSMPFIWHLHEEPRDFYRYTKYGLKHLFEKSGFEVLEINALLGILYHLRNVAGLLPHAVPSRRAAVDGAGPVPCLRDSTRGVGDGRHQPRRAVYVDVHGRGSKACGNTGWIGGMNDVRDRGIHQGGQRRRLKWNHPGHDAGTAAPRAG